MASAYLRMTANRVAIIAAVGLAGLMTATGQLQAVVRHAAYSASAVVRHDEDPAERRSVADLDAFTAHLGERLMGLMTTYDVPGLGVALILDGELAWSEAYGLADVEQGRPMSIDATYRAESISKAVTAWGIMKLIEQGRIGLDDPVQQHITSWQFPESQFAWSSVTVRQLLNHTAGLPPGSVNREYEYSPRDSVPSLHEALSRETRLIEEPGTSFGYSNPGFNLLELLIEDVTGQAFADYMQMEILDPLGMHSSSFTWSEELDPTIATGYDLQGNPVPTYVYAEKGSGGLFASVEDVARFVAAGMPHSLDAGGQVLRSDTVESMHSPGQIEGIFGLVADGYGLGHFVDDLAEGGKAVWAGGQGHGWMTDFHAVPQVGAGIVILTNSQRSWPLIADALNEWTEWNGISSVGFGRITLGVTFLWALSGALLLLSVWQGLRLGHGLLNGRRRFGPLSPEHRVLRGAQAAVFVVVASVLWWSASQDYLFVTSVFPMVSDWLALAALAFALVMLASAVFPRRPGGDDGRRRLNESTRQAA